MGIRANCKVPQVSDMPRAPWSSLFVYHLPFIIHSETLLKQMLSYKYVMLGHLWHKIRNESTCIHKIEKCQPKQKQYIFCGIEICNLIIPPHTPNQVLTQSQSNASLFVFFFCLLESFQVCKILSFVITIIKGSNQHILNNWLTLLQKSTLKVGWSHGKCIGPSKN